MTPPSSNSSDSSTLVWTAAPRSELLRLAGPIMVSTLSYAMKTLVDTFYVGHLGPAALAGVGLGGVLIFTLLYFGVGTLSSVKVLSSQAVGANKRDQLLPFLASGLSLAIGLGILVFFSAQALAVFAPSWVDSPGAGLAGKDYIQVRAFGAPLFLSAVALREAQYAQSQTRWAMVAGVAANLANIFLDWLIILSHDWLPSWCCGWEVKGAAAASVLSTMVEMCILAITTHKLFPASEFGRSLTGELFQWSHRRWKNIRQLWILGWPIGVQFLLEVGSFMILTLIIARMSELDLAGHEVAIEVIHFGFLPCTAFGEAASVMAGQAVGAKKPEWVKRVGLYGVEATLVYTTLCGIIFWTGAETIAGFFTDNLELIALTAGLLKIGAIFQVPDGINIIGRMLLRGVGDVRFSAVVGVATSWACTPPLTLLFESWWALGAASGWWAVITEIVVAATILWWRIFELAKRKAFVSQV